MITLNKEKKATSRKKVSLNNVFSRKTRDRTLISESKTRKRVSRVSLPSSLDTGTNSQGVRGVRCAREIFKERTLARRKPAE